MKCTALFKIMSPTASFQRVWETWRCSIYDHKNEQLPNVHIIKHQILTWKARKLFSVWPVVWLSIQYHGASKKVANVKTGA